MLAKDAESEIRYVDEHFNVAELAELNPYGEVPILVDRDFVIYGADIIVEYLDERLPHPPLLPVDPVMRGRARLMIYRLTRDWMNNLYAFDNGEIDELDAEIKKDIRDGLVSISPVLSEQDYLLGNDVSLVDFYMAPFLWRLYTHGIKLPPKQAKPMLSYAERMFSMESFQNSLSAAEKALNV
jgi:RNA polymerase-associated protein